MVKPAGRARKGGVGNVGDLAVGARDHDVFGASRITVGISKEERKQDCDYYQDRAGRLEPDRDQDDSEHRRSERQPRAFGRYSDRASDAREDGARRRAPAVGFAHVAQFFDLSTSRSLASHGMNARNLRPTSSTGCAAASLRSSRKRGSPAL